MPQPELHKPFIAIATKLWGRDRWTGEIVKAGVLTKVRLAKILLDGEPTEPEVQLLARVGRAILEATEADIHEMEMML